MKKTTLMLLLIVGGVAWLIYRNRQRAPDSPMISVNQDARLEMGGGGGGGGFDVLGMLGM